MRDANEKMSGEVAATFKEANRTLYDRSGACNTRLKTFRIENCIKIERNTDKTAPHQRNEIEAGAGNEVGQLMALDHRRDVRCHALKI